MKFVFGPVPSRRLGRSLGVNNIPPKVCSYTCIYCQLGNTIKLRAERENFYDPSKIIDEVGSLVKKLKEKNERVDYLTIVPDGEPTLDKRLSELITGLKGLGIKVALITNSSHLFLNEVREALLPLDWLSVKVDAVNDDTWRQIDRPHGKISFENFIAGLKKIAAEFENSLNTETMLVKGINDSEKELRESARFIGELKPDTAYISVPTRPPAEKFVLPPDSGTLVKAHQIFSEFVPKVELNVSYEGTDFVSSGDFVSDFLSIVSVHPIRQDALNSLLRKKGVDSSVIDDLVEKGLVLKNKYLGNVYYLRNLRG